MSERLRGPPSGRHRQLPWGLVVAWAPAVVLAWILWRPGATPGYYDGVFIGVEVVLVAFALSETRRWLRRRTGRDRRAADRRHGERRGPDDATGGDAR